MTQVFYTILDCKDCRIFHVWLLDEVGILHWKKPLLVETSPLGTIHQFANPIIQIKDSYVTVKFSEKNISKGKPFIGI